MNITHLAWFCQAFEQRSFAKTAEREFVSRQALGKAIMGLEGELGSPLFTRSETGVEPTRAARAVYPLACRIVENARTMQLLCEEIRREERPRMRIGLGFGVIQSLPAGLLVALEEECPHIDFVIEKGFLWDCFAWLECGKVDFALCPGPPPVQFDAELLVQEERSLLASPRLLEGVGEQASAGAVRDVPLYTPGTRLVVEPEFAHFLAEYGLHVFVDDQYTDYDFIIQKVIAGQGVTTAPQNVVDTLGSAELTAIRLPDQLGFWEVYLHHRREVLTEPERQVRDFFVRHGKRRSSQ